MVNLKFFRTHGVNFSTAKVIFSFDFKEGWKKNFYIFSSGRKIGRNRRKLPDYPKEFLVEVLMMNRSSKGPNFHRADCSPKTISRITWTKDKRIYLKEKQKLFALLYFLTEFECLLSTIGKFEISDWLETTRISQ